APLALEGGEGQSFRAGRQRAQVAGAVPARVVALAPLDSPPPRPLLENLDLRQGLLEFRLRPDDADEAVHHLLEILLDGVGILARLPREDAGDLALDIRHLARADGQSALDAPGVLGGVVAGPPAEDQEV